MQDRVRRAAAFALVATIALLAPAIGPLVAVPFALLAVVGRIVTRGRFFELFARPNDRRAGELRGLVGFTLVATALALLTTLFEIPVAVFVATILVFGYGNLAEQLTRARSEAPLGPVIGFTVGGTFATVGGLQAIELIGDAMVHLPTAAFLGLTGALTGSLIRTISFGRDDQLTILAIAGTLWVLVGLELSVDPFWLGVAVLVSGTVGYLSWRLETASITGMVTGVLLSLATIVLGGIGWFAVLIAFFGVGGVASKYRYAEKEALGVAEANQGARGSKNVLGNAGFALLSVVGYAAADGVPLDPLLFQLAFVGSLATAMSDTLSSEIGVLFGPPLLITTFERVEVGTDGGVSLEGVVAGLAGGALIAGIAVAAFEISLLQALVIVGAGLAGMLVDSVLGATVEGEWIHNQAVNFLATVAGGLVAALAALA